MMKNIFILMLLALSSCSNSDENQDNFVLDTMIEFEVRDNQGNDMLDPENSNSYDESQIKLLYLNNGKYVEFYDSSLDHPKNFLIYKHANNYRIRVFINNDINEDKPETIIQWSENEKDTIRVEIARTNRSELIKSIWMNEEYIWDESYKTEPFFILEK
ncbi:hypothetical protein [Robertkochia solimangrovi]|uniref:hypothetical protein n=1 Tax=Robertkochia solimangrovi TaxID=2213046 RepID=UPI00117E1F17|nr:hypothetical protein [Robertkochia solimangrovi]TRZ42479.1 hypothetical protein DMZ48_13315 [Robertkochia solimangrovi]